MINYLTCITIADKTAFLLRANKLLTHEHNIMGDWWDEQKPVITSTRHQELSAEVQLAYPYSGEKLSTADWEEYRDGRFEKKFNRIVNALADFKDQCGNSTLYPVNLDDDITED